VSLILLLYQHSLWLYLPTPGHDCRPYLLLSPSAEEDFEEFRKEENRSEPHDAVVVGLAPTKFTYENLNVAFRILSALPSSNKSSPQSSLPNSPGSTGQTHRPIPLFATHRARFVRSSDGQLSLGPGPFVAALETAVGDGLKAETVGKPEITFFEVCLRDLGCKMTKQEGQDDDKEIIHVNEVAVIGDDIEADLAGGALELGLQRILGMCAPGRYLTQPTIILLISSFSVKTGKYREGDENRGSVPPDAVYDSIGAFVESLLQDK
jgi:ribonucleotide monophosphatase NagD (HAD superfamily)